MITQCPWKKLALFWHGLFATAMQAHQANALLNQIAMFGGRPGLTTLLVELSKDRP
jgi:hypothetical protein